VYPTNTLQNAQTSQAGSGNAHNNMHPYLTVNYIIKL
jgi:microcystin-dependent protein